MDIYILVHFVSTFSGTSHRSCRIPCRRCHVPHHLLLPPTSAGSRYLLPLYPPLSCLFRYAYSVSKRAASSAADARLPPRPRCGVVTLPLTLPTTGYRFYRRTRATAFGLPLARGHLLPALSTAAIFSPAMHAAHRLPSLPTYHTTLHCLFRHFLLPLACITSPYPALQPPRTLHDIPRRVRACYLLQYMYSFCDTPPPSTRIFAHSCRLPEHRLGALSAQTAPAHNATATAPRYPRQPRTRHSSILRNKLPLPLNVNVCRVRQHEHRAELRARTRIMPDANASFILDCLRCLPRL